MSGELKIDVDACYEGAEKLRERASEPDAAASTLQGEVDAAVEGLDPMGFDSKGALAAALAAWKRRIHGHRLLFDDLAEFIETNTALAEQHDAESESDLMNLGDETIESSDGSKQTGYEALAPVLEHGVYDESFIVPVADHILALDNELFSCATTKEVVDVDS